MKENLKQVNVINKRPTPFLRWAGGKKWFLKHLSNLEGCYFNNYFEPFLGGGAVFFHLENYDNAFLSDINEDLIEAYQCVKHDVENVMDVLSTFKNKESVYYEIRATRFEKDYQRAAQFIYLNKTSFNGIYRVNRQGKYNVPYGFIKNVDFDFSNLLEAQKKLQKATISCGSYEVLLPTIQEGDLIFLDPPYTVAHENNGFIEYNKKLFSVEDQKKLADFIVQIKNKGAFYVLTNAKHDEIRKIYAPIDPPAVFTRSSTIGGTGARREVFKEYIFTNCTLR